MKRERSDGVIWMNCFCTVDHAMDSNWYTASIIRGSYNAVAVFEGNSTVNKGNGVHL